LLFIENKFSKENPTFISVTILLGRAFIINL